jgi:hypothetical protein
VSQLPDEAKELDKELRQVTKDKNEAVRGQDFEKVYVLQLCSELMCCLAKMYAWQHLMLPLFQVDDFFQSVQSIFSILNNNRIYLGLLGTNLSLDYPE